MKLFADFEYNGQPNMETIQFGAVLTTDNCSVISTYQSLVKPMLPIIPYVEKLTGITNEMVEESEAFSTVFTSFINWLGNNKVEDVTFYAWGEDWKQLRRECKKNNLVVMFDKHIKGNNRVNYQKELSKKTLYKGQLMTKSIALEDMKKLYNLPFDVKHNALSDALDTMMVFKKIEIDKINYDEEKLKRIFEEKQAHIKRMKENQEKQTYNMFKDLIELGEFVLDVDSTLFRKLKSGPGEFFTDIEGMVDDESAFSKKKECIYIDKSVKLKISVVNDSGKIWVKYTAYHILPNTENYLDKKGEFQFEITDENRRFVSKILHYD